MRVPQLSEQDIEKELLSKPLVAKIASQSADGGIRITPIWFGDEDGSLLMNTFEDSELVRNIKRNPGCSVLIDSLEWPYTGIHYWGKAALEGPENDADAIARLFAPYVGGYEGAREYAQKLIGWGKRIFVRFRPHRQVTWDFRQG